MSNLPEWIQKMVLLSDDEKIREALTIAWKALEKIRDFKGGHISAASEAYKNSKDAMRRIEELGK